MRTFRCQCGNTLYFENSQCAVCGCRLGFISSGLAMTALEPAGEPLWRASLDGRDYRLCANYQDFDICNWLVPAEDPQPYCVSCRLNHMIPNLDDAQNLTLWYRIEKAKRRLLYTLFALGLPVIGREQDPMHGLAFEFLQDEVAYDEFSNALTEINRVMTGHHAGMITINIMEAEPGAREDIREKMNEGYRTLLGHFRHESGHYYWDRLVAGSGNLDACRALFGDERQDYKQALQNYYANGPQGNWQDEWISAYASAHPWEDWAETWAHYLHMVDTLETAWSYGISIEGRSAPAVTEYHRPDFTELMQDWTRLTLGLNALNRSMGLADAYPFILSERNQQKLRFVHELIAAHAAPGAQSTT